MYINLSPIVLSLKTIIKFGIFLDHCVNIQITGIVKRMVIGKSGEFPKKVSVEHWTPQPPPPSDFNVLMN